MVSAKLTFGFAHGDPRDKPEAAVRKMAFALSSKAPRGAYCISIAIVIGPTPPGTGVIAPARWIASAKATSCYSLRMNDERVHPDRKVKLDPKKFKAWQDRTRRGIEHALKAANWIMVSAAIGAIAKKTGSNWAWAGYNLVLGLVCMYIATFMQDVVSHFLNLRSFRRIPWDAENLISQYLFL